MPEDPLETRATRIKRLRMRSMRRGIKEMDLILSAFAAKHLDGIDDLDLYDALLSENDHDLYAWVIGLMDAPEKYATLIAEISANAMRLGKPA